VVGSVDVIGQPKAEAARRLLEALSKNENVNERHHACGMRGFRFLARMQRRRW
jgi:hypothetical protein